MVDEKRIYEAIATYLGNKVASATVPIYFSIAPGQVKLDRSSIYLKVTERSHFLLTAMHGLRDLLESRPDIRCVTQPGPDSASPIDLTGGQLVGWDVPIDIGAIRLRSNAVVRLANSRRPITLDDLDLDLEWDEDTPFVLTGFPTQLESKIDTCKGSASDPRLVKLLTNGYTGKTENDLTVAWHIAIVWPKSFGSFQDHGETRIHDLTPLGAVKAHGVSGGGIWRVGLTREDGSEFTCRLAGIQHSYHRQLGYALGARVHMGLYAIWRELPDLAPVIEAWRPHLFPLPNAPLIGGCG
jgi:hypothetical protein